MVVTTGGKVGGLGFLVVGAGVVGAGVVGGGFVGSEIMGGTVSTSVFYITRLYIDFPN